ncbi:NAD(P)-dependent alcohol dehydrogenase [Arthrobacter sp. CDRTa11]|nr:NAD(P)-dependent alcohol dehydrogenase [Arthrobacter sp. CDRTa11]
MKAAVYSRFDGPDVVRVQEVPAPSPRRGELLIKVHASTVSAADRRARSRDVPRGLGLFAALALGVFRPRRAVLGMDVAGVVEAVGAGVTSVRPGTEVIAMLGSRFGGHAEYVCLPAEAAIAAKPSNMTFQEAVTPVFGGLTALVFLNRAGLKPGDTVLINGASGAVGTAAVQLAKQSGAHVTAVCSDAGRELVTSLGADRVIDYSTIDFTAEATKYDAVMDCVGNAPFERAEASVKPGGSLLLVVADLKGIIWSSWHSRISGKLVSAGNVQYTAKDLEYLVHLAEAGLFRSVSERTYALADVVKAHRFVDTGRKKGSVVLQISGTSATPDIEHSGRGAAVGR